MGRLGLDDLEVRLKNHVPHDYRPYVKVDIKTIDPNGDVPEWELTSNRVNPYENMNKGNKRLTEDSPENQAAKKRNKEIPDWRIGEFLWEFLEGTKTKPDYETEDVELEELEGEEESETDEAADQDTESADSAANLDN